MKTGIFGASLAISTLLLAGCQSAQPEQEVPEARFNRMSQGFPAGDFRRPGRPGREFRPPAFSRINPSLPGRQAGMDENGDGLISEAEYLHPIEARNDNLFLRLDRNGDNLITPEDRPRQAENQRPRRESRAELARADAPPRMQAMQACLAESGITGMDNPRMDNMAGLREQMQNDNFSLDLAAFTAPIEQQALDRFHSLDLDGNGQLNEAEITAERENRITSREQSREMMRNCMTAARQAATTPDTEN